jgi:predicted amidophosphoribosyltransferase
MFAPTLLNTRSGQAKVLRGRGVAGLTLALSLRQALWSNLQRLDALCYPHLCALCRQPLLERGCPTCPALPEDHQPRCTLCALELAPALAAQPPAERRCAACRRSPPPFAGAICIGSYHATSGADRASAGRACGTADAILREWVLALKHGARPDLARPLGWQMARRVRAWELPESVQVTSVPLHPARWLERGYDQAGLLGRALAEALGRPFVRALQRSRCTLPQGSAASPGRSENVRGAFRVGGAGVVPASTWILVDDVGTSLATAREAAQTLGAPGRVTVYLALVARAQPRQHLHPLSLPGS